MNFEINDAVLTSDLPAIYAFIARNNPSAAERVLESVHQTFARITQTPSSGVVYSPRNPGLKGIRMLPVDGYPNYLVFYRSESDLVRVLYVVHGARHLSHLFRREPRI
ncbi:MAG TPA: type II toxin-antitoxin system RelE/ParE family toxin [Chthoniobacter sp.]